MLGQLRHRLESAWPRLASLRHPSWAEHARRLRRIAREETGITLVMAVGVLGALSLAGGAVIAVSSTNARSAEFSSTNGSAYSLAEAGIAHGLSILGNAPDAVVPTLLPSTTVTLGGGTATFSGTLSGSVWTITSTGSVPNPTGAAPVRRTVTRLADVLGIVPGATPPEWNRLFHDNTDRCLTINNVTIPSPVTSRGDLCLRGTGKITGADSWVEVGDDVTLQVSSSIGHPGTPIARADIADRCRYNNGPWRKPCSAADRVFASTITTGPQNLQKPTVDMAYWYQNAKPGPKFPCTVGGFPYGFDNDSVYNASLPDSPDEAYDQITPRYVSYTCQVKDASGNLLGELSWNHLTHVLKIHGTIFIDGDVRFDDDGQLVNYRGRGILYAAGDIEFDELVCAGGDGTWNCRAPGQISSWNPEQNMMIILSGDDSEYDQGDARPLRPAAFQGVMYARDNCLIHQDFHSSGPIICDEILIRNGDDEPGQGGGWPSFYPWPPLQSLIAGQMYGYAATAPDQMVVVRDQWG